MEQCNEKLDYTVDELDTLFSAVLTELTDNKKITITEGLTAKIIFNTFLHLCLNKDLSDALLTACDEVDKKINSTVTEAGDIIKKSLEK